MNLKELKQYANKNLEVNGQTLKIKSNLETEFTFTRFENKLYFFPHMFGKPPKSIKNWYEIPENELKS